MGCATPGCEAEGKLRCPTCEKLALPRQLSLFCSQLCFKSGWKLHKGIHAAARRKQAGGGGGGGLGDGAPTKKGRVLRKVFPSGSFAFTGPLRNHEVAFPLATVPAAIPRPDYARTGVPKAEEEFNRRTRKLPVFNEKEIEGMRRVARLGREVLDVAVRAAKAGVTTAEIDRVVHEACVERQSYPSPLNYYWFPGSCCTSVNEVICHGIPDSRPLEDGDVLNIDVSLYHGGYHGDLNETVLIGAPSAKNLGQRRLIKSAHDAMHAAIAVVRPGTLFRELGRVIEGVASSNGHSVVRSYCGHGIGHHFHTAPSVPHYRKNRAVGIMAEGMIFTIEPMINQGSWRDVQWPDKWTVATADGSLSAQFEHTVLVTRDGCEVLTARQPEGPKFWWEQKNSV